ncbi:hypothetical protein I5Q34_07290 [Streptomyces sp. AV19]|uniref:hypothetical protein n=1 Tax=Streptomyces sp. AV19 TaxID=2793068 RepID=UPI0018FE6AD1|nr:hypothetical protein [Streptomyces sp. AV19]MBH1934099.1 hypothetical protein [Streptomyces sp. AV19]MDG4537179.1 hypothetical protein [Streptomyces sp. AV19]
MDRLAGAGAPGVEELAETLADAACHLHDAVTGPGAWSRTAVEDAAESIETTAQALTSAHPEAAAILAPVHTALAVLRERLALPSADPSAKGKPAADGAARGRGRRRGLGHGWQGIRVREGGTVPGWRP